MAILHELITQLNEEQITQVAALKLPEREKQLLHFVLLCRNKRFSASLALHTLKLSETHFYKVSSVIMKKVLSALCGTDPMAQFEFVRNLSTASVALLRHQMRISRQQLKGSTHLGQFYETCCMLTSQWSVKDIDMDEFNDYTRQALKFIDSPKNPEKIIQLKYNLLYAQISVAVMKKQMDDDSITIPFSKRIEKLVSQAEDLNHPLGLYWANHLASKFYQSVNEQEMALGYVRKLTEVTEHYPKFFNSKQLLEPKMLLAECSSLLDRFREAYDIFYRLLSCTNHEKATFRLSSYARFFKVSVTLGEYQTAKSLLDSIFAPYLTSDNMDYKIMTLLQFSCYYLHLGQPENATKYLNEARSTIHGQKQLTYDVQLRFFENVHLFQQGDFAEARMGAEKNLKFLRQHGMLKHHSPFPRIFSSIKSLYDKVLLKKPFSPKKQLEYDFCFTGSFSHFGGALQRCYEMNTPAIRWKQKAVNEMANKRDDTLGSKYSYSR